MLEQLTLQLQQKLPQQKLLQQLWAELQVSLCLLGHAEKQLGSQVKLLRQLRQ